LFEGDSDALHQAALDLAQRAGAIVPAFGIGRADLAAGTEDYALEWLVSEHSVSTNTAAAGGNASLMTIG
jgi:RHH-type proline utilization regulon transcriptional repressor/proline dehydrogenase/delta 1-pyrroline-5-carboxylate dehydrogenase